MAVTKTTATAPTVRRFANIFNMPPIVGGHTFEENTLVPQFPEDPFEVLTASDLLRLRTKRAIFDSDDTTVDSQVLADVRVNLQHEDIPSEYQRDLTETQEQVQKEIKELEEKQKQQQATE